MKILIQNYLYSIVTCLTLLVCSQTAKAQFTDTVTYQYNQNSGSCQICGGGYSCFTSSQQYLIGINQSLRLKEIKILVYHTTCGTGNFYAILNGDTLGSYNRSYNCQCSDCYVDSIVEVFPNLGSYIPNDTNIINFGGVSTCVDRILIVRSYTASATDDAAVLSVDSPFRVCPGARAIKATIANLGVNIIDSVLVNWSYNGTAQTPVNYYSGLDTLGGSGSFKAQVNLGSKTLVAGKTDTIKVWTSLPNGNADTTNYNDTLIALIKPSLSDTLTVGGSNPDYSSVQGAINDLQLYGVCGPVVINIAPGTYNEQLSIGPIPGSSSSNLITIRSASGDSSDVVINYSASLSGSNYTILLSEAAYIKFAQITLESSGTTYAHVVEFRSGFSHIQFENCLITGYASSGTSTNQALFYSSSMSMPGNDLFIRNSELRDGSYAIYLSASQNINLIQILNCQLIGQRYMNGYFTSCSNIHLINSECSRLSTPYSYGYGLYFYNCAQVQVHRNRIWQPNGAYAGIYADYLNGNDSQRNLFSNNFISVGKMASVNAWAFIADYCSYTDFMYNSCYSQSLYTGEGSVACYYGSDLRFRNNSFYHNAQGYLFYRSFSGNNNITVCDNNNYYSPGSQFYSNGNLSSLAQWQNSTGFDSSSRFANPYYSGSLDLHAASSDLNRRAISDSRITDDIDGQSRQSSPDIGADEFTLPPNDAGITHIAPFTADSICVRVALKNHGDDTLTSVSIGWKINGNSKTSSSWSGTLLPGDTSMVCLGYYKFSQDTTYTLVSWTSSPNGVSDTVNYNDTFTLTAKPALKGVYTIGGTNPDFNTFTDAVDAMISGGILDSVVFKVRNGTYSEHLEIPLITGVTRPHAIRFESENQDSSLVILTYATTYSEFEVVLLDGAQGVTFSHMTIKSSNNNSPSRAFTIENGASQICLNNNKIESGNTGSTSTYYDALIYADDQISLFTLNNNHFKNGAIALYLYDLINPHFSNNLMEDQYYQGLYIDDAENLVFENNRIVSSSAYSGFIPVYIYRISGSNRITGNTVIGPNLNETAGMYLYYVNINNSSDSSYIHNNFISCGGQAEYGLYMYSIENTLFTHNNINNYSNYGGTAYALYIRYLTSSRVYNNNIIASNNGLAAYIRYNSQSVHDYNNYHTLGSVLLNINNSNYANLAALLASGNDSNSLSVNPGFKSPNDLHIQNTGLNGKALKLSYVSVDIDGETRDSSKRDMGADEFFPQARDAGVTAFFSPGSSISPDTLTIIPVVTNFGLDTLFSFVLHTVINGDTLTSVNVSDTLAPGDTAHVVAGTYVFKRDSVNNLIAWTGSPNAGSDQNIVNDTFKLLNRMTAMRGVYTIGGTSPDFNSFKAALNAMYQAGIADSVRFRVRTGSYTEQLQILPIPGAGNKNSVVFESESLDSSNVILRFNSGFSDSNYVVYFNGCSGVTFRHLTLQALNTTYGTVCLFENGANNNSLSNNHLLGISGSNSSSRYSVIGSFNSSTGDENNSVHANRIENGSYGMYWYGYGSPNYSEKNTQITNNAFVNQYYMGLYSGYQTNAYIHGNLFETGSTYSNYYGMQLYQFENRNEISSNRVNRNNTGRYGIYMSDFYGNSDTILVANNVVIVGGNTSGYGLSVYYGYNVHIIHNSILMGAQNNSSSVGLYSYYGSAQVILNNIIEQKGSGFALDIQNPSSIKELDYNNYRSNGLYLARWNGNQISNLAALQSASGKDSNTLQVDPLFNSGTDLHSRQIALNGQALKYPAVTKDFEGDVRDTSKRDIGADEFTPPPLDAGVLTIVFPQLPFAADTQFVKVAIKNFGTNSISSLNIDWTFNDTTQSTVNWSGNLASNDTVHVILGLKFFDTDSAYSVKAWTSLPNSYNDTINYNDTAEVNDIYPALIGTYTIGGASPDFNSFTAAVTALKRGGILGQVIFNVRNGTYTEKILIPSIRGASEKNSIIFRSENADSTKVILVNNSNTSGSNYTVKLNGADGISFHQITLSSGNTSYGRIIEIDEGARYNTFSNCIIETALVNSTSTNHALVYIYCTNNLINKANEFKNNIINNGSMGFYGYGYNSTGVNDQLLTITNNKISNQYYTGILFYYNDSFRIEKNTIELRSTYGSAYGLNLQYCRGKNQITGNSIRVPSGVMGIYLYNMFGAGSYISLIANNMILVNGNGGTYGLYLYGSYYNIYHNTIRLTSTNANSYVMQFASSSNIKSQNNIFHHSGNGYALYNSSSTLTTTDYNCYNTSGSNLAYWNGNRSNLSALQSASAKEANSLSTDPQFYSSSDLHVRAIALHKNGTPLSEIPKDFDGDLRDTLTPDIGADEFVIPSPNDAGITGLNAPLIPFASGTQAVKVVLSNYGSDTLKSADIHWTMNGIAQSSYSWTGSIPSGLSDTVNIGNFTFNPSLSYSMTFWPRQPNGVADTLAYNDTLHVLNHASALAGIYTVGGSTPDFNTINDAIQALNTRGVLDTVVFKIRNGTYNEKLLITAFPGMSASRRVTFTSQSADSSKVIINNNSNDNTVYIKGADYLTFSHLTIQNTYYYSATALKIDNGSVNVNILNNRIRVMPSYTYYSGVCILSGSDRDDNLKIQNNLIDGGNYGIQLYGGGTASNTREIGLLIEGNRIVNFLYSGIYLLYQEAPQVNRNTIIHSGSSTGYPLYLNYVYNNAKITRNFINSESPYAFGIYANNFEAVNSNKGLIANNFISLKDPRNSGLYLAYSNYVNVFFNSINLYGSSSLSTSACFYTTSSNNTDMRNNIFSNPAGTYAFYSNSNPAVSNYNNFYSSGTNLINVNSSNYTSVSAWNSASSRDANSKSVDPTFFSATDLHTSVITLDSAGTPISGLTEDFDGQTRNASKPDIGADEYNSLPNNLAVTAFITPVSGCEVDSQFLQITIFNFGSNTQKNFPVRYTLNGGSVISQTYTDSILPGASKSFTFSGKINTSIPSGYAFVVWTDAGSEQYRQNDTLRKTVVNSYTPDSVGTMIPADSATNIAFPFTLSWTPSQGATLYDIYIWADSINNRPGTPFFSDVSQISKQVTTGLGYGVKYKWQVVAKNPYCSTDGPVQRFTIKFLPDLRITSITPPTSAFSGNNISVSWTIRNSGPGTTGSSGWYDVLYLSKDKFLDGTDLQLAGVPNLTSLNSNQSYNNSTSVLIPNGTTGKNYILIHTDKYGNTLETNEGNNISSDSLGINVSLTAPPDLRVTSITKPSIANSGQTINISYTVKNIGSGGTVASSWRDYIYLNNDSSAGGTLMKNILRTGALAVDSSYKVFTSFQLPNNISGGYYVIVRTDAQNNVYEHASESNNDGISDSIRVILAPPADLIVRNLTAPDSVSNRQTVQIKYQLINQGGTQTTSSWYDQLYISKFSTFNTGSSTLLANIPLSNLGSGDTFFLSRNIMIPQDLNGPYYFFLIADGANNLFEGSNDTNNSSAPRPVTILSPDLRVKSVTAPAADTSGRNITVNYKVINAGPGDQINSSRTDRIYLSRYFKFHPDSVALMASPTYGAAIPAGDSISRSVVFKIPDGTIGNRYVYVYADEPNNIFENGKDTNNTGRSAVMTVHLAPYPDLVPVQILTTDSTEAGEAIQLTYAVKNNGLVFCPQGWTDKIYLSKDSVFNLSKSTLLKSTVIVPGLKKDSTYNATHQIALSNKLSEGNYYFYIFTDAENKRYEYVYEDNNLLRSGKVYIDGYPPVDLEIFDVNAPDTLYSGTQAEFSWKVKNIGQANTIANTWFDRVYLSSDSTLGAGDLYLGQVQRLQNLNQNASYSASLNANIPNGLSGKHYLIVRADYRDDNADTDTTNNIGLARGSGDTARLLTTILSKSPDLQIVNWNFPSSAVSGQPARFIWQVENKGDTTTRSGWWNDRFYLSTDYTIDQSDPILGTVARIGNVPKKGSYLDTAFLTIPSHLSGNYIVIVKTDEANREYEHNAEHNNTAAAVITITLAPPGDLVVTSVSAPDSVTVGKQVTVNYQISNKGSNPISGTRTDNLYLSVDSIFDGDDILIGSRTENASIVPNATRNLNISGNVSSIKPGAYYFIVYADIKDNINESKDTNNTGHYGVVNAGIPELPMLVITPDVLTDNSNLYYRLNIPEELNGESVIVTLKGDSVYGRNELYLRHGDVPTRYQFDYAFSTPFFGNQEILVPSVKTGEYYILVYGDNTNGNIQNITLLARKLDFEIRRINPGTGGNTGTVTLKIEGSKFDSTTQFLLQLDSAYGLETPPLYHVHANDSIILTDPTQVFATFNLKGRLLGRYHMVAVKNGDSVKLLRSFIVEPGVAPDIQLNVLRPGNTRANATVSIEINFTNAGNTDMMNAELELISTAGAPISFTPEGLSENKTTLKLKLEEVGAPPGILRPRGSGTIIIYTTSSAALGYNIILPEFN